MNVYLKTILATVAGIAVVMAGTFSLGEYWAEQDLQLSEDVLVELRSGQSFANFAEQLSELGVIEHPQLWAWRARLSGDARRIQAGEYWVRVGDTPRALLARLLAGDVASYQVQLLEGWTVRQVIAELQRQEPLQHELGGLSEQTLLTVLGLPGGHAEGMFFPDTYRYVRGSSDADILRRAYAKLQEELSSVWVDRDVGLPYATPYEALIVASLVEKETARDEDRAHIAQVFVSRLNRRMRLQTDPTVIYGIGPEFDGNLTRKHLRTDTLYNTYTRRGLPPTPIALSSARSLQAVVHPSGGDYLYFVSRGDGSSQFSVSLEEHQAAVRKYQLQ